MVPPCPSGERASWSLAARRILPVDRSKAGICPWVKKRTLLEAEAVVLFEEGDGRFVVLGAGHDVERDGSVRSVFRGRRSFRRGSGTSWRRRPGRSGKVPLGPSKPSRVPEPPATRMTPTSPAARASAPIPLARRQTMRSPSVWGRRTTSTGWTSLGCRGRDRSFQAPARRSAGRGGRNRSRRSRPPDVPATRRPARPTSAEGVPVHDASRRSSKTGSGDISCHTPRNKKRLGETPEPARDSIQNST